MGDEKLDGLRVGFDSCMKLKFCVSKVTSDVGLLTYCELDKALGLTKMGAEDLTDPRQSNSSTCLCPCCDSPFIADWRATKM